MTTRWILATQDGDSYTVPINPNRMTDPEFRARKLQFGIASPSSQLANAPGVTRTFETRSDPVEWVFGGVINTHLHHDSLLRFSKVSSPITITDHFGRTFEVMIRSFVPTERRPTASRPWRFTYEMHALVLRRIQ